MRRNTFTGTKSGVGIVAFALVLSLALATFVVRPARADLKADSRQQFEHAVKLRTMLEGYLEKDRALTDYRQTVLAFRMVYLLTPQAPEATQALAAEAQLYRAMGRLFDTKFFADAINRYNFLLQQYPGTRYGGEALFTIGEIEKNDLRKTDDAEAAFKQFLKRYPQTNRAGAAQQALKEITASRQPTPSALAQRQVAAAQTDARKSAQRRAAPNPGQAGQVEVNSLGDNQPDLKGQTVEPRISGERISSVTKVQTWNSPDSTRIILTLNDTIEYDAARITSPDRIYFNIYRAKVGTRLARKALEVEDGLLQSVRIAQNKPDMVRLVLKVNGEKEYSTFLLANPYRLVIDIHSRGAGMAKAAQVPGTPVYPRTTVSAPDAAATTPAIASSRGAKPAPFTTIAAKSSTVATENVAAASGPDLSSVANPAPQPDAKTAERTALPLSKNAGQTAALLRPPPVPKPTRDGQRSLTRALGLKISRIVIDAGHGGHDTGTVGPHGLMEKDLCLDVALRLGSLIEQKLPGTDVIYTRKDDTFVSLEDRTAVANQAQADLFISIHANSSQDNSARGVETYYLNFATTEEAMEVASRENALSQESFHDLQGLIKKIARNDKIEESKEFASDVQDSLAQRLQIVSRGQRNRGVKKAPFVVLIGTNMPSVLTEISFVSNPYDEKLLRRGDQRQRIADGLYRGISSYLDSLNSFSNNRQKLVSANPLETGTVAPNGNPK